VFVTNGELALDDHGYVRPDARGDETGAASLPGMGGRAGAGHGQSREPECREGDWHGYPRTNTITAVSAGVHDIGVLDSRRELPHDPPQDPLGDQPAHLARAGRAHGGGWIMTWSS
jgi:hypothetical protein